MIVQEILSRFKHLCGSKDKKWIVRKRILDTYTLFSYLANAMVRNESLMLSCAKSKIDFYKIQNVSPSSLSKARMKAAAFDVFKELFYDTISTTNRKKIYAIDGSKIRMFDSSFDDGFRPRDTKSKHLIGMLTAIYDARSREVVSIDLTQHLNERRVVLDKAMFFDENHTLLFDRGYYSIEMFTKLSKRKSSLLFRLKVDAFKQMREITPGETELSRVFNLGGVDVRVIKCFINNEPYYYATNMYNATIDTIKSLYWERWRVEEFYKTFKCVENAEKWKTNRHELLNQEIYIRALVYNITCQIKDEIDQQITLNAEVLHKSVINAFVLFSLGCFHDDLFTRFCLLNKITLYTPTRHRKRNRYRK